MAGADLRLLVEEQAALKRVAVTVATESAAERVFDVVTEEVARLVGADAANLVCFGPAPDEGVIVGKWSQPGVKIPGAGTVIRIEPGAALAEVARTGEPVRMATDEPRVPAELRERLVALGVTSLVAAPIVVSGEIWGGLVVSVTRDLSFRGRRRGAARAVRRPRRRRDRERAGPGGARGPGRRAGGPQPRRRRRRDRGAPGAALRRRLGGDRPAVRRRRRRNRPLCRRSGRGGDRGRLATGRRVRRSTRRAASVPGRRDRARRADGPNGADRPGDGAVRPAGAHARRPRELGRRRSDRGVGPALGRHLDLERRQPRPVPARRRGAAREVHGPRRGRARQRGGARAADGVACSHRPGRRRRAAAARAEPPRRCAAAPGLAQAPASYRRVAGDRGPGGRGKADRGGERRARARSRRAP